MTKYFFQKKYLSGDDAQAVTPWLLVTG